MSNITHPKFNFKQGANLGEMMKAYANATTELLELRLSKSLTALQVLHQLLVLLCIHKNVHDLEELVLEDHLTILGKDIKYVTRQRVMVVGLLSEQAHDRHKRVPLEIVLQSTKIRRVRDNQSQRYI